jgi:hypothetical protein
LGIDFSAVAKAWRKYGIQPWRTEAFKFSTDPELDAKVTDVVGLYLDPPENAVVLWVDEKSHPGVGPRQPMLPMQARLAERRTHDYVCHGTPPCPPRVGDRDRPGYRYLPGPPSPPGIPAIPTWPAPTPTSNSPW